MSPGFGTETKKCDFLIFFESFLHYCLSVGVQVAPGGVELRPRRSQVVRGSLELQNGGLRAPGAVSTIISRLRHLLGIQNPAIMNKITSVKELRT